MSAPLFDFEAIIGGYGEAMVVRGVSASLQAGQVLGITGRNGIGKSTLLKLLYGFLLPQSGVIRFQGTDITGQDPNRNMRSGISYCPQERIVFDDLTVWENLSLMHPGRRVEDLADYFAHFPRLRERLSQHAGTLSGGERKLLSFVRALGENNPLVLIDEPTEGVQHANIDHMSALIGAAKAVDQAFIIVEQNLGFLESVADTLLVMDQGAIVLQGPTGSLTREQLIGHLSV